MPFFRRLKEAFKRAATAREAVKDLDFEPLENVIGDLFAQADVVHIGDTDHRSRKITDWLTKPEVLEALYARGARTLFMEFPRDGQIAVPALANGTLTPGAFEELTRKAGFGNCFADTKRGFQEEALLVVNAARAGLKVVFADGGTGDKELSAVKDFTEEAGLGRDFMFLTDDKEISRRTAGVPLQTLDEFNRLRREFLRARTEDTETAAFMKSQAEGKSLVLYGTGHDFRENFAALGVSARKLSLFPDLMSWRKFPGGSAAEMLGDRVYILSQGIVYPVRKPETPAAQPPNDAPKPG